ncbi:MAG TPA: hypothetical protein VLA98_01705 [Solirubrobacteraceae bacterium]|nr:hypothetical protein [Solirubrobacteraceae bacterium]
MTPSQQPATTPAGPSSTGPGVLYVGPSLGRSLIGLALLLAGRRAGR